MPRKKLSEYRSKTIVHEALGLPYTGWSVNNEASLKDIAGHKNYVVKVDQAIKGRFKKGLVELNVPKAKLSSVVKKFAGQGYEHFIVEPYVAHENDDERYISMAQRREGISLSYSKRGGVDIEANPESIVTVQIGEKTDWKKLANETAIGAEQLQTLVRVFRENHFVFLEINPYIVGDDVKLLDLAVEADDAGMNFAPGWTGVDVREPKQALTSEEHAVHVLDKGSDASFNLSVINPHGSIFLLLSGGGASVVIADEIYNQGFGAQLANYGEYSGNPQAHEAQKYTAEVLKLLLASNAPKKVLFVGGAVANFTDIATTFAGVIAAIDDVADRLAKANVKIYVRRGGPRQEIGLENIRKALEKHGLLGGVYDPSTTITDALGAALKGLK